MGYNSFNVELEMKVAAHRMWQACFKDSHRALPTIAPSCFESIEYVQGPGRCETGSVRLVKYLKGWLEFTYMKEMFEEVDDEEFVAKWKVVEGGGVGKLFRQQSHTMQFSPGPYDDSCYVQWSMKYESIGNHNHHEAYKQSTIRTLKLVEEYLCTHDDYVCLCECQ